MNNQQCDLLEIAANFVNSTSKHIFLTGKAGTGKTTFLRDLAFKTHKNILIVAPTGIAALNAKGVTIHSQFQLPFGSFIPENTPAGNFTTDVKVYTQHSLSRFYPMNSIRKQVLRSTELLIVDEVSMLRADILDAIDFRLKSTRRNYNQSFGGVQVLMIGDLYQLPPIVKNKEWNLLKAYYDSMHFFEAHTLKEAGMIYIELNKIFRQKDERFINLLNNLRNDCVTRDDINLLNKHFKTKNEIKLVKQVITLTTHNYKADEINSRELNALVSTMHEFEAEIEGDFPENLYPLPKQLQLKVGAQIMFVRNDNSEEKQYYNGSIGIIEQIENDVITVKLYHSEKKIILQKQNWENKKYIINDETKELMEDVVGSFIQYPVKSAWAVTIHKSQGLTFDKAIIDVGEAFAPGQVYVALSRLRSLDGLLLRSKITNDVVSTDKDVVLFSENSNEPKILTETPQEEQWSYLKSLVKSAFDFNAIEKQITYVRNKQAEKMEFEDADMRSALSNLIDNFIQEKLNTEKFTKQLTELLIVNHKVELLNRIEKGWMYYITFLENNLRSTMIHICDVKQFKRTKTYANALEEIDHLIMQAIYKLDKTIHVVKCILSKNEISKPENSIAVRKQRREKMITEVQKNAELHPKSTNNKSGRKKKIKGETYEITYNLLSEGKGIKDIAKYRNLTVTTIEGHVAKGIQMGKLNIDMFLSPDIIGEIRQVFGQRDDGLKGLYTKLEGKYTYGKLRMVQAHLIAEKEKK